MGNILEMKGIEKAFFGVTVLDKVDFSVRQGEVHALLGENGAGKSTLMNILAGVYTRDDGEVVFDGKPLVNTTVQKSESAGIAFVHQEINVFNDLKVYENIFMRKEIAKFGVLNKRAMIKQSRELFERLGVREAGRGHRSHRPRRHIRYGKKAVAGDSQGALCQRQAHHPR